MYEEKRKKKLQSKTYYVTQINDDIKEKLVAPSLARLCTIIRILMEKAKKLPSSFFIVRINHMKIHKYTCIYVYVNLREPRGVFFYELRTVGSLYKKKKKKVGCKSSYINLRDAPYTKKSQKAANGLCFNICPFKHESDKYYLRLRRQSWFILKNIRVTR